MVKKCKEIGGVYREVLQGRSSNNEQPRAVYELAALYNLEKGKKFLFCFLKTKHV